MIRLKSGITLVLEVKGAPREVDESKWRYMKDWVAAVNSHGGFGPWSWDVLTPDKTLKTLLDNQSRLSLPAGWLHLEFTSIQPILSRSGPEPSQPRSEQGVEDVPGSPPAAAGIDSHRRTNTGMGLTYRGRNWLTQYGRNS